MKESYTKPTIAADNNLAEGVYAASGASGGVTWTEGPINPTSDNNGWGARDWNIDMSALTAGQTGRVLMTITFNQPITAAYGGTGAGDGNVSGNVATLEWYDAATAETSFTLTAQVNSDINTLRIVSISATIG